MSQEAVLVEIASTIRREKIKLVGITATDIFDTLFLARFLREFCPDVRLFVLDSDLLLIRATQDIPLDGTLVVTNYPLIPTSQPWSSSVSEATKCPAGRKGVLNPASRLLFPNRTAEATYNAFSALANNLGCMRDYSESQPPLWVAVVGHDGFWPVAFLVPTDRQKGEIDFVRSLNQIRFRPEQPSRGYLLLCGLLILISSFHIWGLWAARQKKLRTLAWIVEYFRLESRGDGSVPTAFFFVAASLILATIDYIAFLPVWRAFFHVHWEPRLWFISGFVISLLATSALIIAALWIRYRFIPTGTKPEGKFVWLTWLAFLTFYAAWLWFVLPYRNESYLFWYRSFDLAGGTSPVLPPLFLLVALYFWCWTNLRRLHFWETRHPLLPSKALDYRFDCGFHELETGITDGLGATNFHSMLALIFAAAFASPFILRPQEYIAGVEPFSIGFNAYDCLYISTLILLYAFIASSWIRFLYVWSMLQSMLRRLERQPLRHAFDRLPKKDYSWSPIWHSGGTRRTYVALTRSLECLRSINAHPPQGLPALAVYVRVLEASLHRLLSAKSQNALELAQRSLHCQHVLRAASKYLLNELLVPHWANSVVTGSPARNREIIKTNEYDVCCFKQLLNEPLEQADIICAAEEFVALRFVALIRYVSLQLRNELSFVSAAFILSLISLRAYPFIGHHTIGLALTIIFMILGSGVVTVFAQMDKNAILSRIADTEPGKLDKEFYLRLLSYGALPLLTVLASQFPAIGRFVFSWVQPAVEAIH